jgi:hypothetical protein
MSLSYKILCGCTSRVCSFFCKGQRLKANKTSSLLRVESVQMLEVVYKMCSFKYLRDAVYNSCPPRYVSKPKPCVMVQSYVIAVLVVCNIQNVCDKT